MTARWPHVAGRYQAATGLNMWSPLLLIALGATPCAQQHPACPVCSEQLVADQIQENLDILVLINREAITRDLGLKEQVETLENATTHILKELDIVRSRQAASAAVQASQVIMMVTYFLTILCTWGLSRCQKVSEKAKRKEFERLEMQLRSSKAKRRAAAAKDKSAPAQSLE